MALLTSSSEENLFPRSCLFSVGNAQKSHGAKSGLYGGCFSAVPPISVSAANATAAVCGRALSWSKTTVSWANPVFSSSWLHANEFSGRLHNSRRSLSAHGEPSAVRSTSVHQRTAEAWLYPPREINGIFWVVANSSVSTHLTVVLITGHNDESTIRHTSRSRLRNSELSQTFEQCSCTPELVTASALL